jgi:hypothetical protein
MQSSRIHAQPTDIMSGSGIAIHWQGHQSPHHWSQLSPQFLSEETSSWWVSVAGQIFLLLDEVAVYPVNRLNWVLCPWMPSIANGYLLLAAGANNLALQCEKKILSWIAVGGMSTATNWRSPTGMADPELLAPAGPVIGCQWRPQFCREGPTSSLAGPVILLGSQVIHPY